MDEGKMLSEEEVKKIKEKIISQIDSWHATEEQKQQAKQQIWEMPAEQLEDFLIKNKLIKQQGEQPRSKQADKEEKQECPFCLISENKIPSYKIAENKTSLAVLEINPLSSGHILIIPRQHKKEISTQAFSLAKKVAKKIKSKLKPENINISTSSFLEHNIINVIPVYKEEKQERKKATQEELKYLQEKLISKPKAKTTIIREKKPKQLEKAPIRIP